VGGCILIKFGTLVQNDSPVVESLAKISFLQKQDGGGRQLRFWKNSHNFAQD